MNRIDAMRCPTCAEEIRDEAILCRFCGARKEAGAWLPPAAPLAPAGEARARAGHFTLRSTGALLVASAVFEIASPHEAVPLFGAVRAGGVALAYHALFAATYLAMGIGLLTLRPIGYRIVFLGTAIYTLDRVLWLLDRRAQDAVAATQLPDFQGLIGRGDLREFTLLMGLALIASWWGFAIYVYVRRAAFGVPARGDEA